MIKNIYIVHHTHWDREWYASFDEFAIKLRDGVKYILDLLDEDKIKCFYFDGQTVIVEDLKETLSEKDFKRFEDYLNQGIIEIGPNYILADESLSNSEQFVSNLKIGKSIYEKYNQSPKVMYLPDTFGHVSQIPQLSKLSNLDYALVHRGVVTSKVSNNWVGADNTKLNTHVLQPREGYYQTLFHVPFNKITEEFEKFVNENEQYCDTDNLLILNGCDHTFLPLDIKEKIDLLKETYPQYNIEEINLSEFLAKQPFENVEEINGEQRTPNRAFLLPGVLSTRNYLKLQNQELYDLFYSRASVISAIFNNEDKNEQVLNKNCKKMVLNMPHDSICGCSIDSVHTEMEYRYQSIKDSLNKVIESDLDEKSPYLFSDFEKNFNDTISVFNSKSYEVTEEFEFSFDIVKDLAENKKVELYLNEQKLDFELISKEVVEKLFSKIHIAPSYQLVTQYTVKCELNIDSYDFANLKIKLVDGEDTIVSEVETTEQINNGYLNLEVTNNSLKIVNLKTNETYENMFSLKYISDRGDSYNFSPVVSEEYKEAKLVSHKTINSDTLLLQYVIEEKQELDESREVRTGKTIKQLIDVKLTVNKDIITTEVNVNNELSDIKVIFSFDNKNGEVFSDTAFDLVKREEIDFINYSLEENNSEVNYNQFPTLTSIYTKEHYQISHIGLTEMEVLKDQTFLTLMRCISDLSRRDLKARPGGAGPSYKTPDGQMHRELNYTFNIKFNITKYDNQQHLSLYSPLVKQGTEKLVSPLKFTYNTNVSLTSLSRSEGKFIFRFVNLTSESQNLDLEVKNLKSIKEVNFFNEEIKEVDNEINVRQIKTLEVEVL